MAGNYASYGRISQVKQLNNSQLTAVKNLQKAVSEIINKKK